MDEQVVPAFPKDPRFINLTGRTFGKLQVLDYAGKKPFGPSGRTFHSWHVLCAGCGEMKIYQTSVLHCGLQVTCGKAGCRGIKDYVDGQPQQCGACGDVFPRTTEFFSMRNASKSGFSHRCKKCSARYTRRIGKGYRQDIRNKVLKIYGGDHPACACCKENRNEFLTIDHANNDGSIRRRAGETFLKILATRPPDLRVLCYNCNLSRGRYGYCPHEKEKVQVVC